MVARYFNQVLILAALAMLGVTGLQAQYSGELVTIDEPVTEDIYLAGRSVHVLSEVTGDLVAAGWSILVEKRISGDLIGAAESVAVRGNIGDDARLAGRMVIVSGQIKDDAITAGETIKLTPEATIGGRMWAAGRSIEVAGRVTRELRAAGQSISISGVVLGDVSLMADKIEILPGARIAGNLQYRSPNEASIAPEAEIQGSVQREEPDISEQAAFAAPAILGVLLSLLLCVSAVYWLFPQLMHRASGIVRRNPFKCFGLGLALLLLTPLFAIMLTITMLGIPLGITVLAGYLVALFIGFSIAVFVLSDGVLRLLRRDSETTAAWRLLAVAIALAILALVQFLPFIGGLAVLILFLIGLGALTSQGYQRYKAG